MKIIESLLTNNQHYKTGRKITVKGLVLHSVGCPQPSPEVFLKIWNSETAKYPTQIVIGAEKAYECLPCMTQKGQAVYCWHVGNANAYTIGAEMTEPATIKYTGPSTWIDLDPEKTKAHVMATYKNAVDVFAQLCTFHGLDPLKDGVILSHAECHARGIGTNHGDPEHIWKKFGLTMDGFRKAVRAAMGGESSGDEITPTENKTLFRVQVGAYSIKANAEAQLSKVKAAGFTDAFIAVVDGKLYRVQVGAYSIRENAEAQLAKVKAAGFPGFVTRLSGKVMQKEIAVGSIVRVKPFAPDYNGGKLASFVYGRNHTVKSINGDRVVITFNGVIVAAVHKDNLILV